LAVQGKEFTPRQIDQYISLIEYALEHLEWYLATLLHHDEKKEW
jgi:hypothetical protein